MHDSTKLHNREITINLIFPHKVTLYAIKINKDNMPWPQENYVFVHFLYKCIHIGWNLENDCGGKMSATDACVDSQNLCTKLGMVACTCNLCTKGTEAAGSLKLIGQPD